MEDAHTAILNLEEDAPDGNTFFAVYDGHGGVYLSSMLLIIIWGLIVCVISSLIFAGAAVARYAGQNLHKRLVQDEAYKKGDHLQSLKNAFLGTDEDIRSSAYIISPQEM